MLYVPGTVVRVKQDIRLAEQSQPLDHGRFDIYCPASSVLTIVGSKTHKQRMAYIVLLGTQVLRTGYDFHRDGDYLDSGFSIFTVLAKP